MRPFYKTPVLHRVFLFGTGGRAFVLLFSILAGIGCPNRAAAQNDSADFILKAGLSDIKGLKPENKGEENITVASLFESSAYEAPGIITVITEEDIKAGGYRNITDLLNQIPGFSMAADVQNGLSFGIRGNWAEEAKLLFMIDGMPLNEQAYGSFVFGQRVSLINIKRIEVIRGAGSSRYGGIGGLGVINVITKQGQELSGHRLLTNAGLSNGKASRGNLSYNYGGLLPNGVEITTMGSINQGNLSNQVFEMPDSTRANLADSSRVRNAQLYLMIKYKGYRFRQYYEDHTFQATYEPIFSLTRTTFTELEKLFEFKKTDLNLTVNYKDQIPWNTQYGDPKVYDAQNLLTKRFFGGATLKTKFNKPYQFLAGASCYEDNMRHQRANLLLASDKRLQTLMGSSAFVEANYAGKYFTLDAGTRFEQYAYFKSNFAPRVSLAKKFRWWHYKLIYNRAYKLPALQNINLDTEEAIKPEELVEMQTQLGVQVKKLNFTATYFNTTIKHLIVYGYNTTTFVESYINSGNLNNHGLEMEGSYRNRLFRLAASYSFNHFISSSVPEIMRDSANPKAGALALPGNKLVFRLSAYLNSRVTLNAQYIYESPKETYQPVNSISGEMGKVKYPSTHNLNLVLNLDNLYNNIVDLNIGLYNVLGTRLTYLYPFSSGYQPLLGMGRELMLTLKLKL